MARLTPRGLRRAYDALAVADSLLAGSQRPAARRARRLTKPLLMPVLAAALGTDPGARRSPLRSTTLVAQAAGWGGDMALLREGTSAFVTGAGSFAVGHVAYLGGFRRHGVPMAELVGSPAARTIAGAWAISGPLLALAAARHEKVLGPAVLGYSAVLAAMAATATGLRKDLPVDSRRATAAGAVLFLISDTLLGAREFVLPGDDRRLEVAVMATYTGAQALLARGAARAGR